MDDDLLDVVENGGHFSFSCGGIKAWRLCFINKTRWEETSKFNQSCHHLLLQFYPCEARHSNLWTSAVKGHWAKFGQVSESPMLCWLRMSRQDSVKHRKCCLSRKEHQRTRHWHKKVNILQPKSWKKLNGARSSMIDLNTYTIHTYIFIYIYIYIHIYIYIYMHRSTYIKETDPAPHAPKAQVAWSQPPLEVWSSDCQWPAPVQVRIRHNTLKRAELSKSSSST